MKIGDIVCINNDYIRFGRIQNIGQDPDTFMVAVYPFEGYFSKVLNVNNPKGTITISRPEPKGMMIAKQFLAKIEVPLYRLIIPLLNRDELDWLDKVSRNN